MCTAPVSLLIYTQSYVRRDSCDGKAWVILWTRRHDVAVTRAERIKRWYFRVIVLLFEEQLFRGNVEVNNNLAGCPCFTHWWGILGAHINRLHHELADCWDHEVHLCPIILWLAAGKWTSRLNHRDTHSGIEILKMLPAVSQIQMDNCIFTIWVHGSRMRRCFCAL